MNSIKLRVSEKKREREKEKFSPQLSKLIYIDYIITSSHKRNKTKRNKKGNKNEKQNIFLNIGKLP